MSEEKKKKKYYNLGTMMRAKQQNEHDDPRFYIKLEQQKSKDGKTYGDQIFPITLANGVILNDGDILSMYSKKQKFKKSVEEGKMSQDQADRLSFLLFDVVATKNEDGSEEGIDF